MTSHLAAVSQVSQEVDNAGVRRVVHDGEFGLVVENLIQDIGSVAHGGGNDLRPILRELI